MEVLISFVPNNPSVKVEFILQAKVAVRNSGPAYHIKNNLLIVQLMCRAFQFYSI